MAKVRLQSRERRRRKALERLRLGNRALEGEPVKIRTMFDNLWPHGKPSREWHWNAATNKTLRLSNSAKGRQRDETGKFKSAAKGGATPADKAAKTGVRVNARTGEIETVTF